MLSRRRALGAAALGGALLSLSQPSYDLWPLAWVGLAPLLMALRGRTPREAFAVAWTGWFVFSLLTLYWIAPTISNYTAIPTALAAVVLLGWWPWNFLLIAGAACCWQLRTSHHLLQ